ncbi:Decaprenyl diphosphate synthase-like protein [Lophiotrema nucula]|uniref:ditrans,polycis-polyprenyl diphosphate synthase [(2E,6E)-farnesyldiphosphate specific] n=1 Tax=Lophiotrema nucula TaxID=690887 RepID=A0A6A5ZI76_9PLEO|nr:Decaprenyl diphosphate synthase-like protein [Lophiotrema nucula]
MTAAMASTGITPRESVAFRRGKVDGRELSVKEREDMVKRILPDEPSESSDVPSRSSSPLKSKRPRQKMEQRKRKPGLIKQILYIVIHAVVSFLFSVFFRFRRSYRLVKSRVVAVLYHHHRTPEFIQRDIKQLERLPKHLSVILDFNESDEDQGDAGLEGLLNNVCEIAAWTASAGIPLLSVYEQTGVLKNYIPQTHQSITATLETYFGPRKPTLSVRAPHLQSYSPPLTPPRSSSPERNGDPKEERPHLTVLLLSANDGRNTMVDLTKTLTEMAQNGALQSKQIDSNLIDAELRDAVSTEPDLLVLFSPTVTLKGYPPWQLRLTEIFHLPDNKGVNYQAFLRALYKFAKAEMRLGR